MGIIIIIITQLVTRQGFTCVLVKLTGDSGQK